MKTTNDIRQEFLEFFKSKQHVVVQGSSLIPNNDPTLLFTNAGMNQFKDIFLGVSSLGFLRATTAQKCVRAGGKHNDLDNVGYTARHHTFFEMLGNFSFGDYFKTDALKFAFEFLTVNLLIPQEKLYVTVYHSDIEAYNVWLNEIKVDPSHIIKIGNKEDGTSDNFWQMGDTGPCGPCSEIFYDHGPHIEGGLPGSENQDGDRFVEIWNCVFMEFNRDSKGVLHNLPKPSVDTGMGLERISAVMQNVSSNYEIDLFKALINRASIITGCNDLLHPYLKILADHIRSVSFLIADGVLPSNEGRGYVLRRILRRAISFGYKLGMRHPFFHKMLPELVTQMGESYSELLLKQDAISQTIYKEEEKFFVTITSGMDLLLEYLSKLNPNGTLDGEVAFKLYDTYGFPLELTSDIANQNSIRVDNDGFDKAMQRQKDLSRASSEFKLGSSIDYKGGLTKFCGYEKEHIEATITGIYVDNNSFDYIDTSMKCDNVIIVLDTTVCYAMGGGQIGDSGIIQIDSGAEALFEIKDTHKVLPDVIGHVGNLLHGTLRVGARVIVNIDLHKRLATARNHSATHLLHQALCEVLGSCVTQMGSLVNDCYMRFDFSNPKSVTLEQLMEVERIVNHVITQNYPVVIQDLSIDDAKNIGAKALFSEKYKDVVRVVQIDQFSMELCGGTHVKQTGDIGVFVITSESAVGSGVRRIEAITSEAAIKYIQHNNAILAKLRLQLKAQNNDIILDKIALLEDTKKDLNNKILHMQKTVAKFKLQDLLMYVVNIQEYKLLCVDCGAHEPQVIGFMLEEANNILSQAVVVLSDANNTLQIGVSKSVVANGFSAKDIVKLISNRLEGKGGGGDNFARFNLVNAITKQDLENIKLDIVDKINQLIR